jgi:hypothetical protein
MSVGLMSFDFGLKDHRTKQSHKVDREEEDVSSNRPELVSLWECLETHPDNENLLYLTDNQTTLQTINKWIGGGDKLSPVKTVDVHSMKRRTSAPRWDG